MRQQYSTKYVCLYYECMSEYVYFMFICVILCLFCVILCLFSVSFCVTFASLLAWYSLLSSVKRSGFITRAWDLRHRRRENGTVQIVKTRKRANRSHCILMGGHKKVQIWYKFGQIWCKFDANLALFVPFSANLPFLCLFVPFWMCTNKYNQIIFRCLFTQLHVKKRKKPKKSGAKRAHFAL